VVTMLAVTDDQFGSDSCFGNLVGDVRSVLVCTVVL